MITEFKLSNYMFTYNAAFIQSGINFTSTYTYALINMATSKNKNLKGLSVTIPYKKEIIAHLDSIDPVIRQIGAVNCIKITSVNGEKHLRGYNTDVVGFELSLKPLLNELHKKALILGTGGAAMAVAFVLDKLNIEYVFVSRQPNGCKQIRYEIINEEIIKSHSLIINTTPLGMHPKVELFPPLPYQYINKNHLLFDLNYNPEITEFLRRGQKKDASIKNGYEMLSIQADKAWEIWQRNI